MFMFFLVSNVVALPAVAIKGVHWAKDGPKFAYCVEGCDASYMTKYKLGAPFTSMSQCYHGAGQVKTPIYLGAGPKGSRSCGNECTNFEQPFRPISLQRGKNYCLG